MTRLAGERPRRERNGAAAADDHAAQSLVIAKFRGDFPEFRFATQTTWNGVSIVAVRMDSAEGLHTVITGDPDEMLAELALSRIADMWPDGLAAERK